MHVAPAVDEVDGARRAHDLWWLVEDLVDPLGRGRGPLAVHDHHPELAERRLEDEHVGLEREQRPHAEVVVDDQDPAVEQDHGQPDPGQVLQRRCPGAADVGVLDVGPLELVGRPGEGGELLLLGGEGLHDPHAGGVFLDQHGDVGEPGLDEPGDRVDLLPHGHADDEGDGQRDGGDQSELGVEREHLGEGDEDDRALDDHRRRHHQVLLDRTHVGVGPGDQLADRDAVVEGERQRHVVLVDDVAQVVLEAVSRREQASAGRGSCRPHGRRWRRRSMSRTRIRGLRSVVWPAVGRLSVMALPMRRGICTCESNATNDITSERDQIPLWVLITGHARPQPALGRVRVDRRPRRGVGRGLGDRLERVLFELLGQVGVARAEQQGARPQGPVPEVPRGVLRQWRLARARSSASPHSFNASRALATDASSSSSPAIEPSLSCRASSADASRVRPSSVRARAMRRRSSTECARSTAPRRTSPSTTAVTLGADTASFWANLLDASVPLHHLDEHPVLSRREVQRRERHLDLPGEPGGRPADRGVIKFVHRIVSLPNLSGSARI